MPLSPVCVCMCHEISNAARYHPTRPLLAFCRVLIDFYDLHVSLEYKTISRSACSVTISILAKYKSRLYLFLATNRLPTTIEVSHYDISKMRRWIFKRADKSSPFASFRSFSRNKKKKESNLKCVIVLDNRK